MDNEEFYRLTVWNHSTPGFISADKQYIGQIKNFDDFNDVTKDDEFKERYKVFKETGDLEQTWNVAYNEHKFLQKAEVLHRCTVKLDKSDSYEVWNVWKCSYYYKYGAVEVDLLYVKEDVMKYNKETEKYIKTGEIVKRYIKPKFQSLYQVKDTFSFSKYTQEQIEEHIKRFKDEEKRKEVREMIEKEIKNGGAEIGFMLWGYPKILDIDNKSEPNNATSRLWLPEFESETMKAIRFELGEEFEKEIQSPSEIKLDAFFYEIFGDG